MKTLKKFNSLIKKHPLTMFFAFFALHMMLGSIPWSFNENVELLEMPAFVAVNFILSVIKPICYYIFIIFLLKVYVNVKAKKGLHATTK